MDDLEKYYNLFVKLAMRRCTQENITDKAKLRAHNAAFRKIYQLQQELKPKDCDELWLRLMEHEDVCVKIIAAEACLDSQTLSERARALLTDIAENAVDPLLRFDAFLLLRYGPGR